LKKVIKELAENKDITILASHDLQHTVEVCDRIVALNKGKSKDIQTSGETLQELEMFFCGLNFHISKETYFTSHYTKFF
jgi:ABC-2 type transport system ATP-binding protein